MLCVASQLKQVAKTQRMSTKTDPQQEHRNSCARCRREAILCSKDWISSAIAAPFLVLACCFCKVCNLLLSLTILSMISGHRKFWPQSLIFFLFQVSMFVMSSVGAILWVILNSSTVMRYNVRIEHSSFVSSLALLLSNRYSQNHRSSMIYLTEALFVSSKVSVLSGGCGKWTPVVFPLPWFFLSCWKQRGCVRTRNSYKSQ